MIKMIVCDLDETLLNDEKKIGTRDINAVRSAMEHGVRFVPATGRGYTSIDYVLETLRLIGKEGEYSISNNGAIVIENKNFRHISFYELSRSLAEQIIEFGFSRDLCVQVFTATDVFVFNIREDEKKWLFLFKPDAVICRENNLDLLDNKKIVKIMYQNEDVNYMRSLENSLSTTIREHTTISYSSNRYMEFTASGVSKGTALLTLAEKLDIKTEEIIAVGDNNNDLSMLMAAGISATVANASPEVKQICDYISPFNNNENAIADIIDKYVIFD